MTPQHAAEAMQHIDGKLRQGSRAARRLREMEASAGQAQAMQAAHQSSVQALRAQFRAYQAAKAQEVSALEARLRRTLGISSSDRRSLRRWPASNLLEFDFFLFAFSVGPPSPHLCTPQIPAEPSDDATEQRSVEAEA